MIISSHANRFSAEEKAARNPLSWLPFGVGPRQCVAMRLALLEVKVAIVRILQGYRLVQGPETEVPLKLAGMGLTRATNGVWVRVEKRKS